MMLKRKKTSASGREFSNNPTRLALLQGRSRLKKARVGHGYVFFLLMFFLSALLLFVGLAFWQNQPRNYLVGSEQNASPLSLNLSAKNAIVIDAQTGQVLGEKQADQKIGIASQSKMLTAYGVLEGIRKKRFTWDSMVEITTHSDWSKKDNAMFSHLEITAGQKLAVKELFAAMFTSSANDAALALADFAKEPGQSQQAALQGWAKSLKLTGSEWYNAAGQVNQDAFDYQINGADANAENKATVRQLGILAYQIVQLDPAIRTYYEKQGLVYHPQAGENKIKLTEGAKFNQEIKSKLNNPQNLVFEGLKTGSTPASGGALTALVKDQNDHEFLTVVSGAGQYTDQLSRYQNTVDAINQVLNHYQPVTYEKGQSLSLKSIKNNQLASGRQDIEVGQSRTYWLRKGQKELGYYWPTRLRSKTVKQGAVVVELKPALQAKFLPEVGAKNRNLLMVNQSRQNLANGFQKIYHWLCFWSY